MKGGELADVVERAAKVVLNLLAGAEQVPVLAKESERLANRGKGQLHNSGLSHAARGLERRLTCAIWCSRLSVWRDMARWRYDTPRQRWIRGCSGACSSARSK